MAYVTVPKDLTRVKSKIVFGLTKRQLICFGGALLVGVPLYFLLRGRVTRCRPRAWPMPSANTTGWTRPTILLGMWPVGVPAKT